MKICKYESELLTLARISLKIMAMNFLILLETCIKNRKSAKLELVLFLYTNKK